MEQALISLIKSTKTTREDWVSIGTSSGIGENEPGIEYWFGNNSDNREAYVRINDGKVASLKIL